MDTDDVDALVKNEWRENERKLEGVIKLLVHIQIEQLITREVNQDLVHKVLTIVKDLALGGACKCLEGIPRALDKKNSLAFLKALASSDRDQALRELENHFRS